MTLNDQKRIIDLWVQFWGGNEMAFSQLYCLCFDDLLAYGRRVGGDNEMVEDLIQDLFLLKSATTRLYDTEAKIICIVSKKGAQCIECHHKDI